ncbi:CDP-glycerol glycerophosphotransferase family protein [Pseudoxanthomonas koreensis]|uniref:CDP-glycerol glycerophosphotransferase family protein n=1 Tax=Pseudoxanthomonas koreensis TaxID=266061 RepID=UPI0035A58C72
MSQVEPSWQRWGHRRITGAGIGRLLLAAWWLLDRVVPKRMDHWAFFGHPLKPDQLVENARAVFEQARQRHDLHCHVFHRGGTPPLGLDPAGRAHVWELGSIAGLWALARCGVLMLTNSTAMDMSLAWRNGGFSAPRPAMRRRVVVNMWHGIPLKRLFALANPAQRRHGDRIRSRRLERRHYDGLVASSDVDSHAMAAIFHPIPPSRVWACGLPRNDFLLMPESQLPADLVESLATLHRLRAGRRLVLYAPTYRDASVAERLSYPFSPDEIERLAQVLQRHGAVLGLRGHYLANGPVALASGAGHERPFLDLGHEHFPEIAPVLRASWAVVTDYSSVYIDALCLERPVVSFAYDLEHYRDHQNGLLYHMGLAFPGPVARDFDALINALDRLLSGDGALPDDRYRMVQRIFFAHADANSAQRVIAHTQALVDARRRR